MPEQVQLIDWGQTLENHDINEIKQYLEGLNCTEQGRLIHNWLENNIKDSRLQWERNVSSGRVDAYNPEQDTVYEFKTKHPNVFPPGNPYDDDLEQVYDYLDSDLNPDQAHLVYINRGELTETEEFVVQNGMYMKL